MAAKNLPHYASVLAVGDRIPSTTISVAAVFAFTLTTEPWPAPGYSGTRPWALSTRLRRIYRDTGTSHIVVQLVRDRSGNGPQLQLQIRTIT